MTRYVLDTRRIQYTVYVYAENTPSTQCYIGSVGEIYATEEEAVLCGDICAVAQSCTAAVSQENAALPVSIIVMSVALPVICICIILAFLCLKLGRRREQAHVSTSHIIDLQELQLDVGSEADSSTNTINQTAMTSNHATYNSHDVFRWFTEISLPQYNDLFASHGYYTHQKICSISDEAELQRFGIESAEHRSILMTEIRRMQIVSM